MASRSTEDMHAEFVEALNRISDGIEEHSKIMSKVAHVLGFKLDNIEDALQEIKITQQDPAKMIMRKV